MAIPKLVRRATFMVGSSRPRSALSSLAGGWSNHHDDPRIIPWTRFSIEPALYLPNNFHHFAISPDNLTKHVVLFPHVLLMVRG
jgi:hypothetical protein